MMGGRSERNEYLLLHAFTEKGFICPDKEYGKQKAKQPVSDSVAETGLLRAWAAALYIVLFLSLVHFLISARLIMSLFFFYW